MHFLSDIVSLTFLSAGGAGPGRSVQRCRHFGLCDPAPVYRQSVRHREGQSQERRTGNITHQGLTLLFV